MGDRWPLNIVLLYNLYYFSVYDCKIKVEKIEILKK